MLSSPLAAPISQHSTQQSPRQRRWFRRSRRRTDEEQLLDLPRDDQPLRAEVLSLDQLERHGRTLANWHQLSLKPTRDRLLPRLNDNSRVLSAAYEVVNVALAAGHVVPSGAEWLLDNFYLVVLQVRLAREHLPVRYSLELPQLAAGTADGLPRIYDLATELISHADGLLDAENLERFVAAYQSVRPLLLGELWAIPIMLRLALIENLRRVAVRIALQQIERDTARQWGDRVVETLDHDQQQLILVLAELIRSRPKISGSFAAEFAQRLQGRGSHSGMAVSWLEHTLAERGLSIEQTIGLHSQSQAADQVSMGNSITSLRSLGAVDWKAFVERQSSMEAVLRTDPSGFYPQMDFATRDQYRHVVEKIAKRCPRTQDQVARVAIELAQQAQTGRTASESRQRAQLTGSEPDNHVGYFLVDAGRQLLERSVGFQPSLVNRAVRLTRRFAFASYLGTIAVVWLGLLCGVAALVRGAPWTVALPLGLLALVGSQFAISLVNWTATLLFSPRPIQRLDFSLQIPADQRTIVVVPTMLSSPAGVESLLEQLEMRYLANRDEQLSFALLTDFTDAAEATQPRDDELVELARVGIERLNAAHCGERAGLFFLFHRPRSYNPQQAVWMGRERKRGKLADFNALLREGRSQAFSVIVGAGLDASTIRYVITLDTDTQLPRDSAAALIGCMAHPLNRPRFDSTSHRVIAGYAILQPRVCTSVPDAHRSLYSRMLAGSVGIDPYTHEVSDVYQDLFGEGSFIGKGIYDLAAFEAALEGRLPDNRILSHDLIEGCCARSGLINNVEVFEGLPSRYLVDLSRRLRWIRGDWQIAGWLGLRVPNAAGSEPNPLSWLSRWKLFDNLRRSLMAPCALLLFVAGWLGNPAWSGLWTGITVGVLFGPILLAAICPVFRRPKDSPLLPHWRSQVGPFGRQVLQGLLNLAVLPFEAVCHVEAIARTLYRLLVSRHRLLEWMTASDADLQTASTLRSHYARMSAGPLIAVGLLGLLAAVVPQSLVPALPLLILWLIGPALAWRVSQPLDHGPIRLQTRERLVLRRLARRTWRFFETFVTEQDHWLPPDNYQEVPTGMLATRTSPTNIGLCLLSNVAAYDFGYLSVGELLDRTRRTCETLERLERFRGHFFNWYDTRSLRPLDPRYISSVDSGNLLGHLLVLRSGLLQLVVAPVVHRPWWMGLQDTLNLVSEAAEGRAGRESPNVTLNGEWTQRVQQLRIGCDVSPDSLTRARQVLDHLVDLAAYLGRVREVSADAELLAAVRGLEAHCRSLRDEVARLAPWTTLPLPDAAAFRELSPTEQQGWTDLLAALAALDQNPTLESLASGATGLAVRLRAFSSVSAQWLGWQPLLTALDDGAAAAADSIRQLRHLADQCGELAQMDFRFLYDDSRDLLAIGFSVADYRRDASCYDLLASEARLASYAAIAQHQLPREHWFALGRMHALQGSYPTLLSWSGSMFEYLMPMLVMPSYRATLLHEACRGAVQRQMAYGRQRQVPWGISESCYNVTDAGFVYQYRAFGVPGLGLQRGLGEDLVIAPYASVMAAMLEPVEACRNIVALEGVQALGEYGFYDAIDYTPNRLASIDERVLCRTYMAHHSGMSLLALDYVLNDQPMQQRFSGDPTLHAHELLLQERLPSGIRPVVPHASEAREPLTGAQLATGSTTRSFDTAATAVPEVHLLSNGSYHVLVTNSGAGYSRWRDLAVTRWHADPTRDADGQFCYLRDLRGGAFWSTTAQPTNRAVPTYKVLFSPGRAEFRVVHQGIDAQTMLSVSTEDDVEVRRVTLKNLSRVSRTLELTTYGEVVLASAAADAAHRAFSNLSVQTELLPDRRAILCTRRPRTPEEHPPYLFHVLIVPGENAGVTSFETDRAKFIGRGRSLQQPAALDRAAPLSNTSGSVLDPIVGIRHVVQLDVESSRKIDVVTGVAETREQALALIERYQDHRLVDRIFELAWTHSQIVLQQLGATAADAQLFSRLAGAIVYGGPAHRASVRVLNQNRRPQSGLWAYGISGDRPIVLVMMANLQNLSLVRRLLQAHAFWRMKGLEVDLVIWNEDQSGYRQQMHDDIMNLVAAGPDAQLLDKPGGVFIRRGDQMPPEDRVLLQSVARVLLNDALGPLHEQLASRVRTVVPLPLLQPSRARRAEPDKLPTARQGLVFYNGLGGFTADGKEYVIQLRPGQATPAPWCNVLANERFGTVVSESGTGYTWQENAHEFRLTPWRNDPVCDPVGEALYIRDDETGGYFSPTPLPARGTGTYIVRHGFGYSVWESAEAGLATELWAFVAVDAPVKFSLLKIKNTSSRRRTLSVFGYVEWVLGEQREKSSPHVVTEVDPTTDALLARNPFQNEFGARVAFFQVSEGPRSITCDRSEFLGRNGSPAAPAALGRVRLSGKSGAGLDPCAAAQVELELAEGEERELVFILGAVDAGHQVAALLQKFSGVADAHRALDHVWNHWNQLLGTVHIDTPDPSVNVLANGWLLYQTLACRMWGRSGFYQSGGAYGFRDQLQDSLALLSAAPWLVREHILRCAARQFREGDVQHWWHPPTGRGVRTHISDDYLWLPYVTAHYVAATGDSGILDETAGFLSSRSVAEHEESYYDLPRSDGEAATLYEHCQRAVLHGLRFGERGLPLMGTGDWNDGMNLVGAGGKGESVWLALFLYDVLNRFETLARARHDDGFADRLATEAARLHASIDTQTWDGAWFRRAYFDNGEPLGSSSNVECQIDALPQSWSVISGAAPPERTLVAMQSVYERLVRTDHQIIQLFDPPFDNGTLQPGYIKGYVPGVRENGGQYTHAAVWTTMAYALLGETERAWECLNLINPVNHALHPADVDTYKVEPYVVAADVYGAPPHLGRGGWTWYTGSAGWMYRLVVEQLIGVRLEAGSRLVFRPCVPLKWGGYKVSYRFHSTWYRLHFVIRSEPTHHVARVTVDGFEQQPPCVSLVDDHQEHRVDIVLGPGD